MGKELPRWELTGCIRRGKKVDMIIYRRVMALSHLAVGFCRYLQLGLAVTGKASDIALQSLSQMTIIHAAFLSTGQINPGHNDAYSHLCPSCKLHAIQYDFHEIILSGP